MALNLQTFFQIKSYYREARTYLHFGQKQKKKTN